MFVFRSNPFWALKTNRNT